jgi:hypothetical protein
LPFDTKQLPAGYHGKKEAQSLFTLGKASWWGGHYWNWASAQLLPHVGPYFGNALTLVLYLTLNALDKLWKCWLWEESLAGGKHQKRVFWLMPACDELFALGHVNQLTGYVHELKRYIPCTKES